MEVTLEGMLIDVSDVQCAKAELLMEVTLEGMLIDVSDVQK